MVISIDSSLLLAWAQTKAGIAASTSDGSTGSTSTTTKPANPTPPWSSTTALTVSSLVQAVQNGSPFINPATAKLNVTGANNATNADYKNLFALYQGLSTLNGIAQQAGATGVGATQLASLEKTFASGMSQVQTFLGQTTFNTLKIAQGAFAATEQTTAGAPVETDTYTTGTLTTGTDTAVVPAFQGDVAFSMTATNISGVPTTVNFDLSEMGSTTRSLANVVLYMNSKLAAAGLTTRVGVQRTAGTADTVQENGKAVTVGTNPDQFALQIKGSPDETLSFSAPTQGPAVYLTQASGATASTTAGATTSATQQLVKLSTDPTDDGESANGRAWTQPLGANIQSVNATAAGSDGSLYVLANVTGTTPDGQTIQGQQDVDLIKYDSAGNVVFDRTLGAADSATGYALAVSGDGNSVAVTGTVTGDLAGTDAASGASTDPSNAQGFVSVYDAQGDEQWTQTTAASLGGQPNAVAFGSDGSVYIAGSTLPTDASQSTGFLQGFTAAGDVAFTTPFDAVGPGTATGVTVSGSTVYVAGAQKGDAVVQSYDLNASGAPTPGATRDLGAVQGGGVAGVTINADGSVVVAGTTHNGALDVGATGQAYTGGEEAFVASLSPDLQPSGSEILNYYNGGGDTTATGVTVSGGQVYLTGDIAGPPTVASAGQPTSTSYAAEIDPTTGAVNWSQQVPGLGGESATTGIAVDPTGSSVLDQLGLPTGTINYIPSNTLVADTSLRAGDQFSIKSSLSGLSTTVTIGANDTYATLAAEIERASDYTATATVATVNGVDQLKIAPANPRMSITLSAGPAGRNALPSLGLTEGVITTPNTTKTVTVSSTSASTTVKPPPTYSLKLPSTLDLSTPAGVKAAQTALQAAMTTLKSAYTAMTTPPATAAPTGTVPAYLTAQIADYQDALARLTGGQSSSGSTA